MTAVTATSDSSWQGLPATGREVAIAVIDIVRIIDDQVVEH
jgi:predicted ester cyclase